jgi:hypothetical protein
MGYPRETVVAEKFQAMVMLGIANSRMKDFFDLWTLARRFEFAGVTLCAAIRATFQRRQTALPAETPTAWTAEFSGDRTKQTQWRAFIRKGKLLQESVELSDVTSALGPFLMPPTRALVEGRVFTQRWVPGGPWARKK